MREWTKKIVTAAREYKTETKAKTETEMIKSEN